jgi:hypothetical protein
LYMDGRAGPKPHVEPTGLPREGTRGARVP